MAKPWRLQSFLANDLETVTIAEHPVIAGIKAWLLASGALGALMSGSGPTVFAVFREQAEANRVARQAKTVWRECWVQATTVVGTT
jgi:4-diphosphocytidyl-2-C-methyl-D-erythritol kinase